MGDAWQPFAFGQMCYAFHIALKLGIKLVFYGENEAEYGNPIHGNGSANTMPLPTFEPL